MRRVLHFQIALSLKENLNTSFLSFIYCLNNTCTERCTVSCISPLWPPYWFYYLVVMKSWFSFFVIYSTKSIFLLHLRNSYQFYLNKRFSTLHASTSWRSRSLQHCNIVLSSFSLWSGLKRVAIKKTRAHIVKSPSFNHVSGGGQSYYGNQTVFK